MTVVLLLITTLRGRSLRTDNPLWRTMEPTDRDASTSPVPLLAYCLLKVCTQVSVDRKIFTRGALYPGQEWMCDILWHISCVQGYL